MRPATPLVARAARAARLGLVRLRGLHRDPRVGVFVLSLFAAVLAYAVARGVFPYHSVNHDEGVYLQQAAMLLEGQLYLHPPVSASFRPWFFVADDGRLYPKYAPVTAAVFAAGKLAGGYRLALAGVAAAVVGLTYAVVAEAFDRRIGLLSASLLVASPLFLIHSGVFLPYAPTTAWNLLFALAYLRADRTGSLRWAAFAGGAAGVAFFARPYTAVLFAAPFVAHALWTLRAPDRATMTRHLMTTAAGLAGVAVALGFNATVTGAPLTFPYEAFAPRDGLGFGRRAIGAYERTYTPELALQANAAVLARLFSQWVVAGPLGTALAAVGLLAFLARVRRRVSDRPPDTPTDTHPETSVLARRAALAGLFVTIAVGNVYFWGNLNLLGDLAVPDDGLVAKVGPVYHFDLLVPTAAFAAVGARTLAGRARDELGDRFTPASARRIAFAGLLLVATVFGVVAVGAAAEPVMENREASDQLVRAYEPIQGEDFDGALLFLPTPYGNWLNHPFQVLRNDPGFDGPTVYAIRENQFAVVDAYPDRQFYRYTYRGEWTPVRGTPVEARLQRVRAVRGDRIVVDGAFGVPAGAEGVTIRLTNGEKNAYYVAEGTGVLPFHIEVADGRAGLAGESLQVLGNGTVPVDDRETVVVWALVDHRAGGFEYRLELPVAREDGDLRALTPYLEVCRDPRLCGGEQAYVPRVASDGVFISAEVGAENG